MCTCMSAYHMHKTLFIQFLALPALTFFSSLPFTRPYQRTVHPNMLSPKDPRKRTVNEEGPPASVAAEVEGNTKILKTLPFNLPETMPGDGLVRTVSLPPVWLTGKTYPWREFFSSVGFNYNYLHDMPREETDEGKIEPKYPVLKQG